MDISLKVTLCGSILDIGGGGEGVIGRLYGENVIAIDNRPEELAEAPNGFQKRVMDARRLDFADDAFDAVTFFYSLMFMDAKTQRQALAEAVRVLKRGGRLCIWDADIPSAYPDPFIVELDIDLDGSMLHTSYGVVSDIKAQTMDSIIGLLESVGGLSVVEAQGKNGQFHIELDKI